MKRTTLLGIAVLLVAAVAALAWTLAPRLAASGASATAASAPGAGPAVTVTTVAARREDFALELGATGTVSALNRVEIHPQVSAAITRVHIREGQTVQAGQPLFTLDSRAAEVRVTQAQAQLQKDLATLADAERQLARSRDLLRQDFVSQSAVDTNLSQVEAQAAVVAADRAAIQAARVDLGYARIVAPSTGRVGAIAVYAGSYVTPASPALATVTQLDPIAVSFPVPQRHIGALLASLKSGSGRVTAQLPDARGTLTGTLQFVDSAVDANAGTVQVKAQFANPKQQLWPGAYVDVKLAVGSLPGAILVPQAAIIQGAQAKSVYVVGADGKAQLRTVDVVASAGDVAVVTGVQAAERVIVDGKQNLRPGSPVVEQAAAPSGAASRPGRRAAAASGPQP
ncbi:efflux RND transporter periplasmic adaptor subunit [Methylibium sp.]|uniref:efflux RND transporter periplasmic adaptor subunit n=1 Tax=Methylibium sp. TaxID=2067992 RepID=UPI003D1042C7